ncbi:hypothetical protein [Geitlerinema sp. PCC 7407]|uniref:hypothetical protein n=1 Tax=Geitlerinema sp. PCC 7407 TaxID=1173025 RepID=UPI00029F9919|nr:hypothetical protein [Geitlerinema sp. PCC 7407]AFY66240.1 hypothetical protein GEI7407_1753 [Geitlerinema sp. PCC 7407]
MKQRLTQVQLEQVVAEVQRLSERQQAELDAEQVKGILQELNLPPELLEEAILQLHRREALVEQQRRRRWIIGSVIGLIALLLLGVTVFTQSQQQLLTRVTAERDRITLVQDDGGDLSTVLRQTSGEVVYRVTLSDAPVGQKLSLSCNWMDPNGQIVHQNRYQTKEITTPVWNTICRHTIGSAAPVGTWKVQMLLGDRLLSDTTFVVK